MGTDMPVALTCQMAELSDMFMLLDWPDLWAAEHVARYPCVRQKPQAP